MSLVWRVQVSSLKTRDQKTSCCCRNIIVVRWWINRSARVYSFFFLVVVLDISSRTNLLHRVTVSLSSHPWSYKNPTAHPADLDPLIAWQASFLPHFFFPASQPAFPTQTKIEQPSFVSATLYQTNNSKERTNERANEPREWLQSSQNRYGKVEPK